MPEFPGGGVIWGFNVGCLLRGIKGWCPGCVPEDLLLGLLGWSCGVSLCMYLAGVPSVVRLGESCFRGPMVGRRTRPISHSRDTGAGGVWVRVVECSAVEDPKGV
jgi:hypothetical protein